MDRGDSGQRAAETAESMLAALMQTRERVRATSTGTGGGGPPPPPASYGMYSAEPLEDEEQVLDSDLAASLFEAGGGGEYGGTDYISPGDAPAPRTVWHDAMPVHLSGSSSAPRRAGSITGDMRDMFMAREGVRRTRLEPGVASPVMPSSSWRSTSPVPTADIGVSAAATPAFSTPSHDSADAPWRAKAAHMVELCADLTDASVVAAEGGLMEDLAHLNERASTLPRTQWSGGSLLSDMCDTVEGAVFSLLACKATPRGVLLQTSRLLWYLTRADKNKGVLGQAHHVTTVITALSAHSSDLRVATNLVVSLSNIALSRAPAVAIGAAGGFEAVAEAGLAHVYAWDMLSVACTFMYHMLYHVNGQVEEGEDEAVVAAARGLAALALETDVVALLAPALSKGEPEDRFTGNVVHAAMEWSRCSPDHAQALLRAGALPALFTCLEKQDPNLHSRETTRIATRLLQTLLEGEGPGLTAALADIPNPTQTLAKVMSLPAVTTGDEGVLSALGKVYTDIVQDLPLDENMRSIIAACPSPIPLLKWLQRGAGGDAGATTWILGRIMDLAFHGSHRRVMAKDNTLAVLATALARYSDNAPVVEASLGIVWLLCFNSGFKEAVKSDNHGILQHVTAAHMTMPDSGRVQERFAAIRSMCKVDAGW